MATPKVPKSTLELSHKLSLTLEQSLTVLEAVAHVPLRMKYQPNKPRSSDTLKSVVPLIFQSQSGFRKNPNKKNNLSEKTIKHAALLPKMPMDPLHHVTTALEPVSTLELDLYPWTDMP